MAEVAKALGDPIRLQLVDVLRSHAGKVCVWSQIGIVGYLLGPLAGGIVAEGAGYGYLWLVPAAAGLLVLLFARRHATPV
jgi:hypothetical protein